MKIFEIFLVISFIAPVLQSAGPLGYMKILKVNVKHSEGRCIGMFVKLKPVSRYETMLDIGCEQLLRPVTNGYVNLKVSAKTASMQNYRRIVALNNLEPCIITEDRTKFPVLNYFFDRAKELYPQYMHNCPYTEIKIYNITLKFMENPTASDMNFFKSFHFYMPNAVYKFHGDAWDDSGYTVNMTVWVEAKYRKRNNQDLSVDL